MRQWLKKNKDDVIIQGTGVGTQVVVTLLAANLITPGLLRDVGIVILLFAAIIVGGCVIIFKNRPDKSPMIAGDWVPSVRPELSCSIIQTGNDVVINNECGESGHGVVVQDRIVTDGWMHGGRMLLGHIVENASRINWSNNTYWTRRLQKT